MKIINLLRKTEQGIKGPMSPTLFAQEMSKQMNQKFNRVARVWFDDDEILQIYEGKGKRELTGHDCLILAEEYENATHITLWLDLGDKGLGIAARFSDEDRDTTIITPQYQMLKEKFEKYLTDEQIKDILQYVVDHPEVIQVKEPVM